MGKPTKYIIKNAIVNFFGFLGYLTCSLQWVWVIMLNYTLIKDIIQFIIPTINEPAPRPSVGIDLFSNPIFIILAAIITITMIALAIYSIVTMPSTIVKTSKKIVHKSAANVTPLILKAQHKKITEKNRLKLTSQLIIIIKIVLVTLPIIFTFLSQFTGKQMIDYYIGLYISLVLGSLSIIFFALQYTIANISKVNKKDII